MLEVRLLGTFAIQRDGKPVVIASRAAQSLFAYLILTAGTPHRREKLAGMLWPDAPEEKARAYLRHELWRLRKLLASNSSTSYLLTDDIHVSFDASAQYWLDVTMLKKTDENTSAAELMEALSAYQGDLLPDFFDEWIGPEREHLRAVFEQRMARLLELLEKEKRWSEILEWAERWISLGQVSEAAYRALMVAYDALGDRAHVTSTYDRFVQALRALDLDPSNEMRTLAFKRSSRPNIPIPLTSFIGRENEIDEIADLLSKSRLVTLTGSGGVGKTRLAIQVVGDVMNRFPDGIWFLDLAPLQDAALIPQTLANILGVKEAVDADISTTNQLIDFFRSRTSLVIFDNCEHLIDACARLVHALLSACQHLSILATSREALRVAGEIPYRVPSLEIPGLDVTSSIQSLQKIESVRLFLERARAEVPGFALTRENGFAIAQVCKRLDGIPLAIELAAARTQVLTVEQILKRLDDRFNLLTGGMRTALPRQQTLWATLEWSYNLLSEKERTLFRRLAVFTGGWTLDAAEKVCSQDGIQSEEVLDMLAQLVNKSLVMIDTTTGEPRYRRLETIRQFAREQLTKATESARLQDRHLGYFLDLAEQADKEIHGSNQIYWMDRLEKEHDNARAALGWCVRMQYTESALRLLGALSWAWSVRDHFNELGNWFHRLRSLPRVNDYPAPYARLLNHMGHESWLAGEFRQSQSLMEESRAIWLELGPAGERGLAETLIILGDISVYTGEETTIAQNFFEQSLALYKKHGDERGMASVTVNLSILALFRGQPVEAENLALKSLAKFQELGDKWREGYVLSGLGGVARYTGDYEQAGRYYEQNLRIFRELGGRFALTWPLLGLAWVALQRGNSRQAHELFKEGLQLSMEMHNKEMITLCLMGLASTLGVTGKPKEAARLFGAVQALREGLIRMEPQDQKEFDYYVGFVRGQLDEVEFAIACADGRKMTVDTATAFALKECAD